MKILKLLTMTITVILFSSCSQKLLNFKLISSKNVDLSKASTFVKGKDKVEGNDVVHIIVIIPTGKINFNKALDMAIGSVPGCVALLDGSIYSKFWFIPYIYGKQTAVIEGIPLIDPSLVYNSNDLPKYGKVELNKQGEIKKTQSISATEYYSLKSKIVKDSKEIKFNNTTSL